MAHEVPVTHARAELSELVNRVAYTEGHVVLTRHGRRVAALVSVTDLERLEQWEAARSHGAGVHDGAEPPSDRQVVGRHRADPPAARA